MPGWFKIIIGSLISLLILFSAGLFIFNLSLNRSKVEYSGELDVDGISSRVHIHRDNFGIPYIFASSDEDAAFALGFCHAQERLFQMDIIRRAGEGRLSEIFGSSTLKYDIMFKTIGIEKTVKQIWRNLDTNTKNFLEAYAKGVNTFINSKPTLPVEFDILHYEPYQWKPEHSLIIGKMMAWELNISWWTDVAFSNLVQKFGSEKVRDIIPDFPENAPTIIPSNLKQEKEIDLSFMETDKSFRNFLGIDGTHLGSNNWVVNANKSASGKPIIANDPHLSLQSPAKWYIAVIRAKDWNCEGFTLPGVPGIVIGKNQNISWAVTNVMTDDADFYIEHINEQGDKYLLDENWINLKKEKYKINVKDSLSVEITVHSTQRGTIISDIHQFCKDRRKKDKTTLSMRWTGTLPTNELRAIYYLNKAKGWDDFKSALSEFSSPGQNFIYADKEGNIGYQCAAKIPIRNSNSSTFVYDGSTSAVDWQGFVPYEQMPSLFNPPQNFIASANNKTVQSFPYHISNLWEPPSRIERIQQLLNSKDKHSVADYKNYQRDIKSLYAEKTTPYILNAFKNIKITDKNLNTTLSLLKTWDFRMHQNSQVPTIYAVFFQHLLKNIFKDEMGETLFNQYIFIANVPYRVVSRLLIENNLSWFDNIKTKKNETRDDIIRQSLADALDEIEGKLGSNISIWQWGNLHRVIFKHMFHGVSSAIDQKLDVGPFEISGDGTTVNNGEYSFTDPYINNVGPSMRYIFDFADPENIYAILTTGQSGNPLNPHYRDMTDFWLTGKYVKINTNADRIKKAEYKLLILK